MSQKRDTRRDLECPPSLSPYCRKFTTCGKATPEEQRVKLISIAKHVEDNPDFKEKFLDNPDVQNRDLALKKMINEALSKKRREELEMYKMYSQDEGFKQALQHAIKRLVSSQTI